jgi:thymidylate synthase ThyX
MNPNVFCLTDENGSLLNPSIQATVLAKYSRSPDSAQKILETVSQESADEFQKKWVTGYGHNSVAELASVPVCFEGVSILAAKYIETWQRGGYSEKSNRYQVFSHDSFIVPPECPETMRRFVKKLYRTYNELMPQMLTHCASLMGKDPEDPEALKSKTVKARAFDNLRYLLPAGTGTNVAAVLNMRDARDMISSLKAHPNTEFKNIGEKMETTLEKVCGILLRHTEPNPFLITPKSLGSISEKFDIMDPSWYVDFYKLNPSFNASYETSKFESTVADLYRMGWQTFCRLMDQRDEHSEVPDVFKTIRFDFDVMMDYGSYRDLQRHRRCEQFAEPLTSDYGYLTPDDIIGTDMEEKYKLAMESINAFDDEEIKYDQNYLQYLVPLGYLHRSVFIMDLKELYYITELRTKPQGHVSYRRVAYEMYDLANKKLPNLMKWCRAIKPNTIEEHN